MNALRWFIGGTLAVPLFHQVLIWLMNVAGWIDRAPYAMTPTKPFGVPQVISLSLWGGLWGLVLGIVLARTKSPKGFWTMAVVFGAIAPTLVAIFIAAPLKGQPVALEPLRFLIGFAINAAWGVGTALVYRLIGGRSAALDVGR